MDEHPWIVRCGHSLSLQGDRFDEKKTILKVLLIVSSVGGTCAAATPSFDADLNGGQVILSSAASPIWLSLDRERGGLRTNLGSAGRGGAPLVAQTPVSDGAWHHVALVWDGSTRFLYVDGVEAGRRSASQMDRVTGAQRFGAGPRLDSAQFWHGSMDDLRMYDRALSAEELAALGAD